MYTRLGADRASEVEEVSQCDNFIDQDSTCRPMPRNPSNDSSPRSTMDFFERPGQLSINRWAYGDNVKTLVGIRNIDRPGVDD